MESLKNYFNLEMVENLSEALFKNYSDLDKKNFIKEVFEKGWERLELKERMRHIVICLERNLSRQSGESSSHTPSDIIIRMVLVEPISS